MQDKVNNEKKSTNNQLITPAVDFLAPEDRFVATSRLYVRLHRHQLLLRKYWWALLVILLVTVLPAYLLTMATPRAYQSDARMWLTGKLDLSEGRLYTEELVNFLGTQADLLRSRGVQERALASVETQMSNAPALRPVPGPLDGLRHLVHSSEVSKNMATAFPFRLKVTESSKSSILELRATGAEPGSTRLFLNAVMAEYLKFKREIREKASDRAVASLAKQVNELAAELKAQQEKVNAFQLSNNVVFLQEQGSGAGSYLALLNRQLATLRTELQLLQLIKPEQWMELGPRTRVPGSTEPPLGEVPAHDLLAGLNGPQSDLFKANQQIQVLKAKREEFSKALQPMHPKILKLNEDIAAQEKLVEISRNEAMKNLVNRRNALQLEVTNLETSIKEWDGKALEASKKMVDFDRLRQDVQRKQVEYDKLLSVISTVDVGKSVDQENVSVLESASRAAPVRKLFRNMALALALALFVIAGLLWILGKFDDRFASSSELADDLPEKIIGQVLDVRLARPNGQMRREMLAAQRFEFLESFRSIRSALWFMTSNGNRPKTILIGSSVPQEGKSTVALYLAATMAIGGSKVLLVDGDMRKAKLHRHFGVGSSPGLAEILNQQIPAEQPIVSTALENLAFLPAGAASMEPGELVLSSQWSVFLSQVYSHFDYVIVDSPPVLAADDAAALAPSLDGVLFVVRGSYTSARMVRDALDALRQRRARVLGLVFNRAISSRFEYHPYQRYQKEYRWHSNVATAA
jgi:capsular exopolysaccharide synthesis family protein